MNSIHTIKVKDKLFEYFIGENELNSILRKLYDDINNDYYSATSEDPLIIIGVLNGAFMFLSDIIKNLEIHCEVHFIKVSSYIGTESSGEVKKLIGLNEDISNKNVLIVEDIIDTGKSMVNLIKELNLLNPKNIDICTLLYKKSKCVEDLNIKYIGKEIEDKFVVGYGMDYDKQGRNIKCIYKLFEEANIDYS